MKKLFLILILSFLSAQGLSYNPSTSFWVPVPGTKGVYTVVEINTQSTKTTKAPGGKSYNDKLAARVNNFNKPRISQAYCSIDSEQRVSKLARKTSAEYWSTYIGGIVNYESLQEFFSIIDNQYSSSCNSWFREYVNLPFHKAIVFGYQRNIIGITGYWAISLSTSSRVEAEQFAVEACEDAHRAKKIESFNCAILFSNNEVVNKEYIRLAKLSEEEYGAMINDLKNELQKDRMSQSELIESADYIEKIKELKTLLDMGIITSGEFEQMKKKIIDNM